MVELNKTFERLAKHIGVPVMCDRNGQIVSITTLKKKNVPDLDNPFGQVEDGGRLGDSKEASEVEPHTEESSVRGDADLEPDGWNVEVLNRNPSTAEMGTLPISATNFLQQKSCFLSSFRFVVFMQCINDIPWYQMRTHPPDSYTIEVEVLDQVLRYKIEPQFLKLQQDEAGSDFCRVDLNRCCVKYFFSNQRAGLQRYMDEAKVGSADQEHDCATALQRPDQPLQRYPAARVHQRASAHS